MSAVFRSTRTGLAATCLAIAVAACSSGPGAHSRPPGGGMDGSSFQGRGGGGLIGPVARPISLLFAGFDTDFDMIVTRAEAQSASDDLWRRLSAGEADISAIRMTDWLVEAFGSEDAQPSVIAFDNNFDGRVSRAEFDTRLKAEFGVLDKSGDGTLSRAELVFEPSQLRDANGGGFGGPSGGGGRPPPRGGRG